MTKWRISRTIRRKSGWSYKTKATGRNYLTAIDPSGEPVDTFLGLKATLEFIRMKEDKTMKRTTRDDLEELVHRMNRVVGSDMFQLSGAHGGWRVENKLGEDALNTGFTGPKKLKECGEAALTFHRAVSA
jgi:hypothetical protein